MIHELLVVHVVVVVVLAQLPPAVVLSIFRTGSRQSRGPGTPISSLPTHIINELSSRPVTAEYGKRGEGGAVNLPIWVTTLQLSLYEALHQCCFDSDVGVDSRGGLLHWLRAAYVLHWFRVSSPIVNYNNFTIRNSSGRDIATCGDRSKISVGLM